MSAAKSERVAALVLAAGSGTRMGARKQFLELRPGERIIDRTISTCRMAADWVGVVIPAGSSWPDPDVHGSEATGPEVDLVIEGGSDRSRSVAAGVAALPVGAEVVVIHSASHPLASAALFDRVLAALADGADGVVPIVAAADTIKRRNPDGTLTTVGRDGLGAAQAPMAYRREVLDRALSLAADQVDESVAVEAVGGRVVAVEGELHNLHVTDPPSLELVRHLATLF